ncbi:MFS family permease [Microbacterium halimionae]|uniref:MFS family permease n=1 Tax=Microbacterium halimionae TaxID=1526413 RepID=A0A7W3JNT7_9MICO|nr:MFS transporter [Microbacterium halimionae]MBA8816295.1 MFS family permease [Microbacterium halimionae]NII96498.1 MFS family permease [Microbacterium halimionae]
MDRVTNGKPSTEVIGPGPSNAWVFALILAMVGIAIGWYGPIQVLLPAQAQAIAPAGREALLAVVTGSGAAASMIANPLWGVLSDRLRLRRGSRTPVIIIGLVVAVVGLVILSAAQTPAPMVIGWVIAQAGLNGPFAVLAALIADRVPEERRGVVGSLFGVAQLAGTVAGTLIAVALGEGAWGYAAIAIAVPLLAVPLLAFPERSAPAVVQVESAPRQRLRDIGIPRPFVAAFVLRFLMNLVSALGLLYLYYFLSARTGVDDVGEWVLILTLIYVVIAGVVAVVGGMIADRLRARRAVAAVAAVILAVGALVFVFAGSAPAIVAAVAAFGAGYGLYLSIDIAIVTDALPDPHTRATFLGVANIASTAPQVLAPVVAAPIVLSAGGYPALYAATAVIALLSLAVLPFVGTPAAVKGKS